MMLDSYPDRADVPNAGVYVGTLAQILAMYPEKVIMVVTDPVRGLQTRCTFRPKPAEVKAACEAEMAPIVREEERRMRFSQHRTIAAPEPKREARPSIEDIKAKLGPDYGIERTGARRPNAPGKTEAELRKEAWEWDWTPSETLLANIAERDARLKGE